MADNGAKKTNDDTNWIQWRKQPVQDWNYYCDRLIKANEEKDRDEEAHSQIDHGLQPLNVSLM